jgi:hypothetical protein
MLTRTTDVDVLAEALRHRDLNDSLRVIMGALGISHGDVAAHEFSGDRDEETYRSLDRPDERAYFLRSWLCRELNAASDRA